ncbi:MAG TPA: FlgO family outer membrane protein [Polyangiales bacterium]
MPRWFSLLIGLWIALPCGARAAHTVAITYFDNNTGNAELAPLAKGLADMLITDLSNVSSLQIVERERLNQVLGELKLGRSKFIDPKTAQKLGKGLAAEFIMTGGYALSGDVLRVDARVIEVATGKVRASEKVEGAKDEFFALEKELVDILVRSLDLKLALSEKSKLRSNATENFTAWSKYSQGLDAKDRGDEEAARKLFQAALEADPNYKAAKSATERLKVIFARDDSAKADAYAELRKTLDPKAPDFAAKVDALLVQLQNGDTEQLRKKVELLTWLAERNLTPVTQGFSRVPMEALAIAMRYAEDPTQWEVLPRVCEYFIGRYPNEDYPKSYCRNAILKIIDSTRKYSTAEDAQKRWNEGRASDAKLDADDWRYALVKNDAGMRKLLALYAGRVRGK